MLFWLKAELQKLENECEKSASLRNFEGECVRVSGFSCLGKIYMSMGITRLAVEVNTALN
jgi:hypothetical protein